MSDGAYFQKQIVIALAPVFGVQVYPQVAPDASVAPYAVYTCISTVPENTLADGIPLKWQRYQIDIYSGSFLQAHTLAQAALDAMLAINAAHPGSVLFMNDADAYETDVKLHRVMQEFSISIRRSDNP